MCKNVQQLQDEEKAQMYESEKEKYLAVLEDAQQNDVKIKTHNDFIEYYSQFFNCKKPLQSTVSENFNNFGIEKNQDHIYECIEPTADKTLAQQYILSTCCDKISKVSNDFETMFFFRVRVNIGSEQTVCKVITDTFSERRYFAVIPCFGSVIVLCTKESNAKSIRKFIYENKSFDFSTEQG